MNPRNHASRPLTSLLVGAFLMAALGAAPVGAGELILPHELEYLGAIRLPGDTSSSSEWPSGGGAMTYYPYGDSGGPDDGFPGSLFVRGKDDVIAEVSIPVPVIPDTPADGKALSRGTFLQGFADPTGGIRSNVDVDNLGGIAYLPAQGSQTNGHLYWTIYEYYNAASENYLSHGMSRLNLANPQPQGAWRLGSGLDEDFNSMKTANYIFDIPEDWANANVGGKMVVSGRHRENGAFGGAQGPALYAFAPWQSSNLSHGAELNATCLLRYPTGGGHFPGYCAADYWTGGAWMTAGDRGAVVIVGSKGLGESYYGDGGSNRCVSWKGFHCDPYEAQFLFYSPDDLAAVARGEREPWQVIPYATVVPTDMWPKCRVRPSSAAYDRIRGILYVLQYNGARIPANTGTRLPIVHAWQVSGVPLPPPDDGGDPPDEGGGGTGGDPPDGGNPPGDDGQNPPDQGQGQGQDQQSQAAALDPEGVAISPNPFTDLTTITLAQGINVATASASVHDLHGRLIHDFGRVGSAGLQFDASGLVAGIYFLRVVTPSGAVTKKISLVK